MARRRAQPAKPGPRPRRPPAPTKAAATRCSQARAIAKPPDAAATKSPAPDPSLVRACGSPLPHVGIVLVHGIGSQAAGQTLREWVGPIIDLVGDHRVAMGYPSDPVIGSFMDRRVGGNRLIELELPAAHLQPPDPELPQPVAGRSHWLFTEAWWAAEVASPPFSTMAEWLGPRGALRRVLETLIPTGRRAAMAARERPFLEPDAVWLSPEEVPPSPTEEAAAVGAAVAPSPPAGSKAGDRLRPLRQSAARAGLTLGGLAVGLTLQAVCAFILVIYGALRAVERVIPIGPLKDHPLTRPIDSFMLDWFGDVFVLLGDPAQAAGIRVRLVDAIAELNRLQCEQIVVVAHSGGAIVSYMTLSDPRTATPELRVDRLVTHGEGLNLARRLSTADLSLRDAMVRYGPLYRDLATVRPNLIWNDFWASQDPAPVGPIEFPFRVHQPQVESSAIWNRLSFQDDHGSYWQNDEEFLVPLLRRLDSADRDGASSTLFPDKAQRDAESTRRRERVAFLSLWRQMGSMAAVFAIVGGYVLGTSFVRDAGIALSAFVLGIPGHEIVTGPLDSLRASLTAPGAGSGPLTWLADVGTNILALGLAAAAILALGSAPERAAAWRGRSVGRWARVLVATLVCLGTVVLGVAAARYFFRIEPSEVPQRILELFGATTIVIVVVLGLAFLLLAFGTSDARARMARAIDGFLEKKPGVKVVLYAAVMIAFSVIAAATVVALIARPTVGVMALGAMVPLLAFAVLRTIGNWRWEAWDRRERIAARTNTGSPPSRRHVAGQTVLLVAALGSLFVVMLLDEPQALWLPALLTGLAAVIGVAIDVTPRRRLGGPIAAFQDATR